MDVHFKSALNCNKWLAFLFDAIEAMKMFSMVHKNATLKCNFNDMNRVEHDLQLNIIMQTITFPNGNRNANRSR